MPPQTLEDIDLERAHNLFQINFFGTVNGMRAAVRQMKLQKGGTIVNIISTTAFDGMNGSSGSMYVASKYALRGLTNVVRDELNQNRIQVIGVYPGGIKTDIFSDERPENINQFMSPDDVAQKIVANLECPNPEQELIIKRPGQTLSHELT
jgi:short-subunit dehydrogenase